jgi:ADP-heptose:LPS heptosyltransferase
LRALRAAFPSAHVTLIGLPGAQELVHRLGYIDRLLPFPGFPGLPGSEPQLAAVPEFFRSAQTSGFDLVIQLHGDGALTNPLCAATGARLTAGFYPLGGWCPDEQRFAPWSERGSEVRRWLRHRELADLHGLQRHRYVCLHPGARLASRRWPVERFAQVADRLSEQGLRVVITGTSAEHSIAEQLMASMRAPALNLTGGTDLGMFAALLSEARLLVCNDTGASHVAAATRTPSVVVCAGSDPERWAPLDTERHHVLHHPVICRPCAHQQCPFDHPCASAVTAESVIARARILLRKEILHAA